MLDAVLLAVAAFVAMEPLTALVHRFVMHGIGAALHRSHHRARRGRFEANDWYPVGFAAVVNLGLWVGFNRDGWSALVPVCLGVTAYGAAYALVHDGYIHRRVPIVRRLPAVRPIPVLERIAAAHRVHHRHGAAPYGMLLPVGHRRERAVERAVRERGAGRWNPQRPLLDSSRSQREEAPPHQAPIV